MATPERARLGPVAAHRHGAPGAGPVARVVVERPPARLVAAALQPRPRAVDPRVMHDAEEPRDRAAHAAGGRHEVGAVTGDLHRDRARVAVTLQRGKRALPQLGAAVDAGEVAQGFADLDEAAPAVVVEGLA